MVVDQYYIVDPKHDIVKAYIDWDTQKKAKLDARKAYMFDELGANIDSRVYNDGRISGLRFDEGVDIPDGLKTMAKKEKDTYYPNGRTKVGKAILEKFDSFNFGNPKVAIAQLGHKEFTYQVEGSHGYKYYNPQVWINKHNVCIAVVPVCSEYPYEPVDGLTEITSSVFNKIIDNQKI
jgi:hypothetical protein